MKRSMVACAALIAGMAIAAPVVAWSADQEKPRAERTAQMPAMPGMDTGMFGGTGMRGAMHDGGEGYHHHDMRHRMKHRMAQMSPQQRCEERVAKRAARLAYTVTKLKLTAEQRPLWDRVNSGLQAARDKQLQFCTSLIPPEQRAQTTVIERAERLEQYLAMRLQAVQQVRPALAELYQALTPEQKAVIDRSFRAG